MDRAALLAAMDNIAAEKPRAINIPGLGDVFIRQITVGEIDDQIADDENKTKMGIARGACRLLCDENGNLLLNPDDPADVARMAKVPWRILREINKAHDLEGTADKGK